MATTYTIARLLVWRVLRLPWSRIILIATQEALAVRITAVGTIRPFWRWRFTTERIVGADGATGTDGAAGTGITDRTNRMLSQLHRTTS